LLGDRDAAVGREITKLHEEFVRGPVSAALAHYNATPPRGEITLVIAGRPKDAPDWSEEQLIDAIKDLQSQGLPPAQIASQLAARSQWPRRKIYQIIINMD
jgi:16S rRNA (cytidine1402-2'-O)-methyltransferase